MNHIKRLPVRVDHISYLQISPIHVLTAHKPSAITLVGGIGPSWVKRDVLRLDRLDAMSGDVLTIPIVPSKPLAHSIIIHIKFGMERGVSILADHDPNSRLRRWAALRASTIVCGRVCCSMYVIAS